jgi:hypothetical protein
MSVITPVQLGIAQAVTPTVLTAADTIPVQAGGRYLLITRNTTASVLTTVVDDPNSQGPAGNTAFNPDVTITTPITTGIRETVLDANRFRDSSGNINLVNTNPAAGTTAEVYGPL